MVINFLYITDNFPPSGMQSGIRALEISKRLIEKETIEKEEFENLIRSKKAPAQKFDMKIKALPKKRESLKVKIKHV